MKRTKNRGNRILIILLALTVSMSLSACDAGSGTESIVTDSGITDEHSETDSVNTQTTTVITTSDSSDTQTTTVSTTPDSSDTPPTVEVTIDDVPELVPDVLKLREKKYDDIPYLETQDQLSEYALWNLLYGRTEFECRLSRNLSDGESAVALNQACENVMSYYLFSSYKIWDMLTKDDGDPNSVYGKVKLVYDAPELDLEARLGALTYVMNNPPPEGGFSDYEEEKEYARKVHDYVACKVTYDPMGYDPKNMLGQTGYETCQEAYNVLGKDQHTSVCAGYARAFALICQTAGINCTWVWGNETEESSHAWNVIYPCDGSEPVLVDVTWDDTQSLDIEGQTEVDDVYFYIPLSSEYEHMADEGIEEFIQYINETTHG